MDAGGTITTFAGNGTPGSGGNGGPATAANLNGPVGIEADSHGNVFIADFNNNLIRKVDASGIITIVAGTGVAANTGDNGPAIAAAVTPAFLTMDGADNLYFYSVPVIRKINTSGTITTIAGGGGSVAGDGQPATSVYLSLVSGIAADHVGNIYISQSSTHYVRRINTSGIIKIFAGTGFMGHGGMGAFYGRWRTCSKC